VDDDVWLPTDDEDFAWAKDELLEEFVGAGGSLHASTAATLLDLKWQHLDGDLVNWTSFDVDMVLFDLYPRSVVVPAERVHLVPDDFAAFMRFLGRHRPDPWTAQGLARRIEEAARRFIAAMKDESKWQPGKRLWTRASEEGVDPRDEKALQNWVDEFNKRPLTERDRIVGRLPASGQSANEGPALPEIEFVSDDELAAAASDARLVQRVIALVRFIGPGRAVTPRHNLRLADAKELVRLLDTDDEIDPVVGDRVWKTQSSDRLPALDFVFRLAVAIRMLHFDRNKVRPGLDAEFVDSPLDIVYSALKEILTDVDALLAHRYAPWYTDALDMYLTPALYAMYLEHRPWTMEELFDGLWELLDSLVDLSGLADGQLELEKWSVERALRHSLEPLEDLGVLSIEGVMVSTDQYGLTQRSGGTAKLTPLGLWAVKRFDTRRR
jgi:hypothetical protein